MPPPQMTGDVDFERVLRVQQNTLEQLVFFLPALWLFSFYVNPLWGALVGAIWLGGRIVYAWGYYQEAQKRMIGFVIEQNSGVRSQNSAMFSVRPFGKLRASLADE